MLKRNMRYVRRLEIALPAVLLEIFPYVTNAPFWVPALRPRCLPLLFHGPWRLHVHPVAVGVSGRGGSKETAHCGARHEAPERNQVSVESAN